MFFRGDYMRAVITGAAGFLGSHLCHKLIKEGISVIGIDNFLTGNTENINDLPGEFFSFIKYDVTNYIHIPGKVDFVIHFASPASPIDYIKLPIQTLKVGSLGTHKALGLATAKKAVFMLASSSEVYGDPKMHPQNESYWGNVNTIGIRGVYDEAKRFSEAMTMAYHRVHKIPVRIARIFNTYGPSMRIDDGRVVPNFITQALNNEDITVFGDGTQTRSLCYVDDLIDGLYKFLLSDYNGPVNIGNSDEISILELAELIKKITKSKSKIVFKNLPEDDPKVRKPDISLAKELLKWEPKIKLEDGLKRTIPYFESRSKIQDIRN
ncbi:MAG: UDP-glucuronic acid decarboxylase family protein [Candidatus Hydrogenedentota bacterium]